MVMMMMTMMMMMMVVMMMRQAELYGLACSRLFGGPPAWAELDCLDDGRTATLLKPHTKAQGEGDHKGQRLR
jgi:hypothetical protein